MPVNTNYQRKENKMAKAPILPKDVNKYLFESNDKYRTYWLQRKNDYGTPNHYKYMRSDGKLTEMYHEELKNGKWVYIENLPREAYVKYLGEPKFVKKAKVIND